MESDIENRIAFIESLDMTTRRDLEKIDNCPGSRDEYFSDNYCSNNKCGECPCN